MNCSEAQLAHNLLWPGTGINSDRLRALPGDREANCRSIVYDTGEFCLRVVAAKGGATRIIPLTNVLSVTPLEAAPARRRREKSAVDLAEGEPQA